MHILHVIQGMKVAEGGPPRIAAGLGRQLAKLGHQVHILATNGAAPDSDGLGLVGVPNLTCTALSQNQSIQQFYSSANPPFDIVHFHGIWNPTATRLASYLRKKKHPYVIMPHGMLDYWSLSQKRLKKKVYLELFERRMLNGATLLHVGNEHEHNAISDLGIRTEYFVLPNGVDPEEFDNLPPTGTFLKTLGQPAKPLISYLARIHFKKGADLLVPAFCRLAGDFPEAVLVIAGPDQGLQASLEQEVEKAGIAERVIFPGVLKGEQRLALLRDSDIFCLPSRQEGHPMSIVEAAYVGIACLATEECHVPELRKAEAAEFVELTVESVEQGLRHLLTDAEHRERVANRAREYARSHYTWRSIAERLADHYRDVVEKPE